MTTPVKSASRRKFLQSSAGLSGALVIAFYLPMGGRAYAQAPKRVYPPNAFLRIGKDNTVTVVVKHLEFGQGVHTSLPMLVCEELECDWTKVKTEFAPADSVYGNLFWGGMQGTGGSSSVANSFDQLRRGQHRPGRLVQPKEFYHLAEVLRERELVAARQHGDRTGTKPPQISQPGLVFQHIDGLELDRTDREKLFEFQAAGSSRLPEHLQRLRVHGRLIRLLAPSFRRGGGDVNWESWRRRAEGGEQAAGLPIRTAVSSERCIYEYMDAYIHGDFSHCGLPARAVGRP